MDCKFIRISPTQIECTECINPRPWSRTDSFPKRICRPLLRSLAGEPSAPGGPAAGAGPSLARRAVNLSIAIAEFVRQPGFVDRQEYERRLGICQRCPSGLYRDSGTCAHPKCGCFLAAKATALAWTCPAGHWDGYSTPAILLHYADGLGDLVQFSVVLQHLAVLHPELAVDVQCPAHCRSLFAGFARRVYGMEDTPAGPYAHTQRVRAKEPQRDLAAAYADSPSTKPEIYLREVHGITPRLDLCRYRLPPLPSVVAPADRFVLIHHQGASWPQHKNLPTEAVEQLAEAVLKAGALPILLDRNETSTAIHIPGVVRWGRQACPADPLELAALASRAALNVGIDSGPGHLFGASGAPTIIVWTGHHPLHYYGLNPNVTHLVPIGHERMIRGEPMGPQHRQAATFFRHHYRWALYDSTRLGDRLAELSGSVLRADAPIGASERAITPAALLASERKAYSQNGEDGVIEAILVAVGEGSRTFAEIGVSQDRAPDGGPECNTRLLAERGWRGVWVDPRPAVSVPPRVCFIQEAATPANAAGIIDEPDLLSIDIDHQDYWVLRAILRSGGRPRVLVCEYNASCGPTAHLVVPQNPASRWEQTDYFGASLVALADLAEAHGYRLVYCESSGNNAFFVRRDLLPPGFTTVPAERLYCPAMYGTGSAGHPADSRKMIEVRP